MSLNGALQIGRSAITASQAGIQVAGQNMANAATAGYSRQVINLAPASGDQIGRGQSIGTGVQLLQVTRQIDMALQARLRDAVSNEQGALITQQFLAAIETIQNELSDNDVSSLMSDFFNSFSELANNPEDDAVRAVVLQQGVNLTDRLNQMRAEYTRVRDEIDRDLGISVDRLNALLDDLSLINGQITEAENGAGPANALRDRRDQIVSEVAQFMDVTAIEQANGAVDLLVGSIPIVLAGESRGIEFRQETINGQIEVSVRVAADQSPLAIQSGRLGALLSQRDDTVRPALDAIDTFAGQMIWQVNRLHSQGQGRIGFEQAVGTYAVRDAAAMLNSTDADLPFAIETGSFFLHLTHVDSGTRTTFEVQVDGDAMSMNDLTAAINAAAGGQGVTADLSSSSELRLTASSGFEVSFSDDTSGTLAALGINTFFTGRDASDMGVSATLIDNPALLAVASGHVEGSNGTALAIADLQDTPLMELKGLSLRGFWRKSINEFAARASTANNALESAALVRESISAQLQAVSGVSLDEEAINLLMFQRQFQAAARFISVIDETMQTLLSMV